MEINDLSDDAFLHIFSFLHTEELITARQVCKRWRDVGGCHSLWWNVEAVFDGTVPKKIGYGRLANRLMNAAPVLKSVTLKNLGSSTFSYVTSRIRRYHPEKIRKLCLWCCFTRKCDFHNIISCFGKHLEELDIMHLEVRKDSVVSVYKWEDDYQSVFRYLPNLKSLSANSSERSFTSHFRGMECVSEGCKLNIDFSRRWPKFSALNPRECAFRDQIKKLTLQCYFSDYQTDNIATLVKSFPSLECFNLICSFRGPNGDDIVGRDILWKWSRFGDSLSFEVKSDCSTDVFNDKMYVASIQDEILESAENLTLNFIKWDGNSVLQILKMFTKLNKLTLCHKSCKNFDALSLAKEVLAAYKLKVLCLKGCSKCLDLNLAALSACRQFPHVEVQCDDVHHSGHLKDVY